MTRTLRPEDRQRLARASRAITAERKRQVTDEGYTPEGDDEHKERELAKAAVAYLAVYCGGFPDGAGPPVWMLWPWPAHDFKVKSPPERNLEIAGALILAELERCERERERAAREAFTTSLPLPF